MTYLIPCHLLTTHTLPTAKLLEPYPRLQKQFLPLSQCIRKGELHKFDLALQQGEDEFVKRRIYLTLERGRDIALRNLLRKVFIAGGFEEPKDPGAKPIRRTRIPIDEFVAAIRIGSQEDTLDTDEVECFLANMMYKVSTSASYHRTATLLYYIPKPLGNEIEYPWDDYRGPSYFIVSASKSRRHELLVLRTDMDSIACGSAVSLYYASGTRLAR